MDVTFLVKINIQDVSQLSSIAEDISDDLISAGHDVASVVPWARPTTAPSIANPLAQTQPFVPTVPPEPPLV